MKRTTPTAVTSWPLLYPLDAWLHGFDYAFGYQLKLMRAIWGLPHGSD